MQFDSDLIEINRSKLADWGVLISNILNVYDDGGLVKKAIDVHSYPFSDIVLGPLESGVIEEFSDFFAAGYGHGSSYVRPLHLSDKLIERRETWFSLSESDHSFFGLRFGGLVQEIYDLKVDSTYSILQGAILKQTETSASFPSYIERGQLYEIGPKFQVWLDI